MEVVLLRVGIDGGSGGAQGPLFADGTFEYIPIPEYSRPDERTYGNTWGRYGRKLCEYLPSSLRNRLRDVSLHFDPEFNTFTYGDPTQGAKRGLQRLRKGDILVFYAGLEGWQFYSPPALYIIGYFEVLQAGIASQFSSEEIEILFRENAHVRHREAYEREKGRLVLVKGSPDSRLLKKAVCISEIGSNSLGRPLKVLSSEMRDVFGGFDGRVSIERSSPRWVYPEFTERAARFVRGLA